MCMARREKRSRSSFSHAPNTLFICSRNQLRSPTAEAVFAALPGIETDPAGLADDAASPLDADQLAWAADLIDVMEKRRRL